MDDPVQHDKTPDKTPDYIIDMKTNDDNKALIYSKVMKNANGWLAILDSNDSIIQILDADYEDISSLHNLDLCFTNTGSGYDSSKAYSGTIDAQYTASHLQVTHSYLQVGALGTAKQCGGAHGIDGIKVFSGC